MPNSSLRVARGLVIIVFTEQMCWPTTCKETGTVSGHLQSFHYFGSLCKYDALWLTLRKAATCMVMTRQATDIKIDLFHYLAPYLDRSGQKKKSQYWQGVYQVNAQEIEIIYEHRTTCRLKKRNHVFAGIWQHICWPILLFYELKCKAAGNGFCSWIRHFWSPHIFIWGDVSTSTPDAGICCSFTTNHCQKLSSKNQCSARRVAFQQRDTSSCSNTLPTV